MSVIFYAAATGLGHLARAVAAAAEKIPIGSSEFELSQDGETVWENGEEYDFVGFGKIGVFSSRVGGSRMSLGRKLGQVKDEPERKVWQLRARSGSYIIVKSRTDTPEVFKKIS